LPGWAISAIDTTFCPRINIFLRNQMSFQSTSLRESCRWRLIFLNPERATSLNMASQKHSPSPAEDISSPKGSSILEPPNITAPAISPQLLAKTVYETFSSALAGSTLSRKGFDCLAEADMHMFTP